jgi:hypothetical protein
MTVVRLDRTDTLSALFKACSVSTTTPSAPKDCASFSQSTPPRRLGLDDDQLAVLHRIAHRPVLIVRHRSEDDTVRLRNAFHYFGGQRRSEPPERVETDFNGLEAKFQGSLSSAARMMSSVEATISGPIPSPGRIRIFMQTCLSRDLGLLQPIKNAVRLHG